MPGFVIEYNRRTAARRVTTFEGESGSRDAMLRRLELEKDRRDPDIEIVSLVSDSLEAIEKTHSRYFGKAGDLAAT